MKRNSIFSFLTQIIIVLSRSIAVIVVARLGGVTSQGYYGLIFFATTVLSNIVIFGFDIANIYFIASEKKEGNDFEMPRYFNNSFWVTVFGSFAFLILAMAQPDFLVNLLSLPVDIIKYIAWTLPLYSLLLGMTGLLMGLNKFQEIFIIELTKYTIFLVSIIFAGIYFELSAFNITSAWLISNLFAFFLTWAFLGFPIIQGIDFSSLRKQIMFSRWRVVQNLLALAYSRIDLLYVSYLLGIEKAGLYVTAKFLVESFRYLPRVFSGPVTVYVASHSIEPKEVTNWLYRITILAGMLFVGGVWLLGDWFVPFLLKEAFDGAIQPLRILAVVGVVQALIELASHHLYGLGNSFGAFLSILGATITISLLTFGLVPSWGMLGAAASTLIGSIIGLVIILIQLSKVTGYNPPSLIMLWIPTIKHIKIIILESKKVFSTSLLMFASDKGTE